MNKTIKIRDFTRGLYLGPDPSEAPRGATIYNRGMHPIADKTWRSRDGSAQLHALNNAHSLYYFADLWFSGVSTSFYRSTTEKKTGLSGNRLSFAKMPPTAGKEDWLFVAGGGVLFKSEDDGTITNWGIEPPETNPTVVDAAVAGNPDGKYYYTVTFRNSETGHRSNAPTIDADTVLLIHADGTDASTTFTDASPNGFTITSVNNSATISTAQSVFGGGSMYLLGGNSNNVDRISVPDNAAFNFGAGDFTVEMFVRFNNGTYEDQIHTLYYQHDSTATDLIEFCYDFNTEAFYFAVYDGGSRIIFHKAECTLAVDTWYHIALIRGWSGSANLFAIVVDGGATFLETFTDASSMPDHDGVVQIGSMMLVDQGYVRYDWDAGETGHGITFSSAGITGVTTTPPFGRGAFVFNGAAYISIADHADWDIVAEANFTIDFFVRHDDVATVDIYVNHYEDGDNYWAFFNNSRTLSFYVKSVGGPIVNVESSINAISNETWHHLAVCKVGNEYGIYVDGVQKAYLSDADSDTFTGPLELGRLGNDTQYFTGQMKNFRITHTNAFGAAPDSGKTDTITVPTAPHDSATDTVLLLYGEAHSASAYVDEIRVSSVARYISAFEVPTKAFSSASEATVTVATNKVTVGAIPSSADAQVDQVELWRTIGGGNVYFLLTRLDEGTTSYTDDIGDEDLGDEELPTDNIVPYSYFDDCFGPFNASMFWITRTEAGERGRLYYSCIGRPEAMDGYIEVTNDDDPLQKIFGAGGNMWVMSESGIFQIYGTNPYYSRQIFGAPGTTKPHTVVATPYGVVYEAKDGARLFNGSSSELVSTEDVQRLFRGDNAGQLTSFAGVVATYGRDEYIISDESQTLALDMTKRRWRDIGLGFKSLHYAREADIVGAGHATLGILDYEKEGENDDNGTVMSIAIEPAHEELDLDLGGIVQHISIDADTSNESLTVYIVCDGTATSLGTLQHNGRSTEDFAVGKACEKVSVRLTGSIDAEVTIYGIDIVCYIPSEGTE